MLIMHLLAMVTEYVVGTVKQAELEVSCATTMQGTSLAVVGMIEPKMALLMLRTMHGWMRPRCEECGRRKCPAAMSSDLLEAQDFTGQLMRRLEKLPPRKWVEKLVESVNAYEQIQGRMETADAWGLCDGMGEAR